MKTRKNLLGQQFGKWIVIGKAKDRGNSTLWVCRCSCGIAKEVYTSHLLRKQSTGCKKCYTEKHGMYGKPPYYTWRAMKKRCYNPTEKDFRYYGGKGIGVCLEWKESFGVFCEWAMQNGFKKGLTIDRIDANKDYTPENCRWVTFSQNTRNRWKQSPCNCFL